MARRPNIPNRAQQPKKQVAPLDPKIVQIFQQGLSWHQRGQLLQAKAAYEQVLGKQPKHFDALHMLGVIALQTKNLTLADELIGKAIEINPNVASAYSNRGTALKELKRLDDALASYDKGNCPQAGLRRSVQQPWHCAARTQASGRCAGELRQGNCPQAGLRRCVLQPWHCAARTQASGRCSGELRQGNRPQAGLRRSVQQPWHCAARTQASRRCSGELRQAIALKPDYAEAFNNRGIVLQDLKRLDDALASYDKAITLKPDYADAFYNRGNALQELKRLDDALASYDKAIALKPDYAEAFYNRGNALQELKRLDDALASYDKAIALKPDYAEAFYNRGTALKELKRLDDALASYDKAIALKPDYEFLQGTKLHTQMRICDWSDLQSQSNGLVSSIADGLKVTPPFPVLGLMDRPDIQLKASKIYANEKYPERDVWSEFTARPADGKIRIGYYSADFQNHRRFSLWQSCLRRMILNALSSTDFLSDLTNR